MRTTYAGLVKFVANEFENTCNEEGFDTFSEMTRCYQMDSADIRAEALIWMRTAVRSHLTTALTNPISTSRLLRR